MRDFSPGDIIRYDNGVSALFRFNGVVNAGRYYGEHVLGGAASGCDRTFFDLRKADDADLAFCREHRPEWFAS